MWWVTQQWCFGRCPSSGSSPCPERTAAELQRLPNIKRASSSPVSSAHPPVDQVPFECISEVWGNETNQEIVSAGSGVRACACARTRAVMSWGWQNWLAGSELTFRFPLWLCSCVLPPTQQIVRIPSLFAICYPTVVGFMCSIFIAKSYLSARASML